MEKNFTELTILALRKICTDPAVIILPETKIMEDLGLESIDFVDFVFELERVTGVEIEITDLSVALSHVSGRRFRQIAVSEIADYIAKIKTK